MEVERGVVGASGLTAGGLMGHSGRDDKHDIHSRAYLAFRTIEDLVAFHKAYNGWTFRDKQGERTG